MSKTKTWKYTLREIIIVIIGITIAFSMNKCAESRTDAKLKEQYLSNLKSDIEADKLQLTKNAKDLKQKLKICEELIPILNTGKKQGMPLMNSTFELVQYNTFSPQDITYKTLINSGDLKLIDDFDLKTSIQGHYTQYEQLSDVYFRHTSLVRDYMGRYMIENADYDQLFEGNSPFTNEVLLKNIVRALTTTLKDKQVVTKKAIDNCDNLSVRIKNAMK
ncbi:DUF6090 family protein [Winogradskyella litorisediminis]|uniref:DUF6090 family protein n=1 Tax=Winogradskyella litorisediminis TaxID=1156618 RepID=A0ABW3N9G5_9FLAO